jgi:hypothetical protein
VDICNIIFTLACTDGGVTGRSLSLTSRHVHELSKAVKLQSLVVTEALQILGLARLLADTAPKYQRVRYLFIGDVSDQWCDDEEAASGGICMSFDQMTARTEGIRCSEEPIQDAYLHIIKATAPTLLTLVVHFLSYSTSMSLPDNVSFPSLIELSLYGHYIHDKKSLALVPGGENTSSSGHPPSFPSLRHLYLAHDGYNPATYLRCITRIAPLLTHLYLPY